MNKTFYFSGNFEIVFLNGQYCVEKPIEDKKIEMCIVITEVSQNYIQFNFFRFSNVCIDF